MQLIMKALHPSPRHRSATGWTALVFCLLASALQAHPGHYHPDETDEFDTMRAMFLHSHGSLDYLLAAVAIGSVAVAWFHAKPVVRIGALGVAAGSLALLPIL